MDSENVRKASHYINDLLLSRGLLRNGTAIDFVLSSTDQASSADASAKIINLVHDIVLQRDREAESRERLVATFQELQAGARMNDAEMQRVHSRQADLQRQLALAQGQEETLKASARAAEGAARGMREEMQRLRSTLQQVRTNCTIDLRQRDMEIKRLKSHLDAKQRGSRPPAAVTSRPGADLPTEAKMSDSALSATSDSEKKEACVPLESPDYQLNQESPEFLAQLCQSLSDDNESLVALIRSSLARLRALQGAQATESYERHQQADRKDTGATRDSPDVPASHDALGSELQDALDQIQTILTNPSFVPLEELEIREEEIARLRHGWEKLEVRWKEAAAIMENWRRRVADDGTLVNDGDAMSPVRPSISEAEQPAIEDHAANGAPLAEGVNVLAGAEEADFAKPDETDSETAEDGAAGSGHYQDNKILQELRTNSNALIAGKSIQEEAEQKSKQDKPLQASPNKRLRQPSIAVSPVKRPTLTAPPIKSTQRSSRKRQASSELAQPNSKVTRATIDQKLREARVEAQEAKREQQRQGQQQRPKGAGRNGPLSSRGPAVKTTSNGRITSKPKKKRSTLSPEELERLLGVA